MIRRSEFHRCKFCINWNEYTESCGNDGKCDPNSIYSTRGTDFLLNPDAVICKAKELDITVTDVLTLIDRCTDPKE